MLRFKPSYTDSLTYPRSLSPSQVEEMVLSQLAWQSNSPLFEAIDAAGSVPPYDEVALPTPAGGRSASSPPLHPRIRHLGGRGKGDHTRNFFFLVQCSDEDCSMAVEMSAFVLRCLLLFVKLLSIMSEVLYTCCMKPCFGESIASA